MSLVSKLKSIATAPFRGLAFLALAAMGVQQTDTVKAPEKGKDGRPQ